MEAVVTPRLPAVVGSTLAGMVMGGLGAALLLSKEWGYNGPDLSIPVVLSLYVVDAALVVACSLTALYLHYRVLPDIQTGVTWVGLGLVAGGLLGLALAIPFASSVGYSNQPAAQQAEVVIVTACCVLGIAAGGRVWLSTRKGSSAR